MTYARRAAPSEHFSRHLSLEMSMLAIRSVTILAALSLAPFLNPGAQLIAPRTPFAPHSARDVASGSPFETNDDRSGPRLGVAYLVGGSVTAENAGRHVSPVISLFGWQLEHQFKTGNPALPVPVTEFVVVVGGMEQGAFLPSESWLIGMRQPSGWEAAIGPTLTGAGVQLVGAIGVTRSLGGLNVPINLAVAPGRRGASISLTTGFNAKRGW
jgi:hypothetical protein